MNRKPFFFALMRMFLSQWVLLPVVADGTFQYAGSEKCLPVNTFLTH